MKDAGNVFIRSVRWIGLVGRHRKEKSMTTSPAVTVSGGEKTATPIEIFGFFRIPKDTEAVELAPLQYSLAPPLPAILPAAESEAKEAKSPVEKAAEPKPVALLQTPTRKRS
ncbi:hypothetical protein JOM56_005330 [Amanita muscaria]